MKKAILATCLLIFTVTIKAQESKEVYNHFLGTRYVNGQSANLASDGELVMQIQHRFGDISGGMYEFFGLDQANMRLGFEYGITDWINLGIGRSNMFKTYDAFGKIRFAKQTDVFPVTLVVSAGGSLPTVRNYFPVAYDNFSDKFSGNVQLLAAKTIGNFSFQVSPGVLNTGFLPSEMNSYSLVTLGFGGTAKLSKRVSWNVEYLHHFNKNFNGTKPLSTSVDIDTGGHVFQLVLSNSQVMFDQALYTHTMGDWAKGNIYFGFNLIREFKLKEEIY